MRAACGGNTIYFGPAAENASMAFEQKTNHAMKLPVIVFTYSFRGRTRPCGCGLCFMLGFASLAMLGTKNGTDQGLRSVCTCGRCKAVRRDKAMMESFSPERSSEEPGGRGDSEKLICPQKRGGEGEGSQPLPPRNPQPPHSSFSRLISSTSTLRDSFYPLNSNACLHLAIVLV